MGGQEKLYSVALIVSICVIIGLALSFGLLFLFYARYKTKHIQYGHEDDDIRYELQHGEQIPINGGKQVKKLTKRLHTPLRRICVERERMKSNDSKAFTVIMNVFLSVIYLFLLALISCSIVFRAQNKNFFIGKTTYLAIMTGSMEDKNDANEYLIDNKLDNQISQYSLIGLDKVESEEDLKLYDVAAYKHNGIVIVHRIIKINTLADGSITYTFRGDSNSASLSYETAVTFDDIVGVYNGFQNYGLGVTSIYLQSNIGIISLCCGFFFLLCANISEDKINKKYKDRVNYLLDRDRYNV